MYRSVATGAAGFLPETGWTSYTPAVQFTTFDFPKIQDSLTSELGEVLETVAREVTVTVLGAQNVNVKTLNRYPVVQNQDGTMSVQLGDLVSRQDVSLVLRLKCPSGTAGEAVRLAFTVRDRHAVFTEPARELAFTFASHAANDGQARNRTVDRAVARLYAAAAEADAVELNRAGHFAQTKDRIERTARKIASYAGSDAELLDIVQRLREKIAIFEHQMSPMMLKRAYHASYNATRMREADGRAKRRPTP